MAIVWQSDNNETHYEVRTAGNSVRLYTNGVFHSQWNPTRPLAGHLWDLLFLPVMFSDKPETISRALVLGVGGGTVINLLNHFLTPKKIFAVDLDPVHLDVARRFFLDRDDNIALVEQDAYKYVEKYIKKKNTKKVDFLVEDLFCGASDNPEEAVRAIKMDATWLSLLSSCLNDSGILVVNFEDCKQLRTALSKKNIINSGFESAYQFTTEKYENAIGVCLKAHRDRRFFQRNIETCIQQLPKVQWRDLSYDLCRVV